MKQQNDSGMRHETVTAISGNEKSTVRPATILVGDGLVRDPEFMQKVLGGEAYRVVQAQTSKEVLETLNTRTVDLVILPGVGSELPGLECCRDIKRDRKTELVPVLVITTEAIQSQIEALSAGA